MKLNIVQKALLAGVLISVELLTFSVSTCEVNDEMIMLDDYESLNTSAGAIAVTEPDLDEIDVVLNDKDRVTLPNKGDVVEIPESSTEEIEKIEEEKEVTYSCDWSDKIVLDEYSFDLFCRTIFCESGGEDYETQYLCALAMLNRMHSNLFPDTMHKVIYQEGQFAVTKWKNFEEYEYNEQQIEVALHALRENPHPKSMMYFRTNHYHTSKYTEPYMHTEKVYFSLQKE